MKRKKSEEYKETLQRVMADYSNYQKRIEKEIIDANFISNKKILMEFLAYENILDSAITHETNNDFKKVLINLKDNYSNIIKRLNIKKMDF
ncbi:MAG: nucleotide exchange factor GrpE, partial [archaeon]